MSGNTVITGHEHVTSVQDPNLGSLAAAPSTPAHGEDDAAPASTSGWCRLAGLARRDRGVGILGRLRWEVVGVDVSPRTVAEESESPVGAVGR